ncbi:hypothetical protein C471_06103 [Halorubrum saccharovorum DSM 1137]|uniref:Uncharacterized protein n=1 Tax=Halorubrum saccharovorum DSM 1137 TaxID=1227484 RepID=M0E321_9EURY|nr:hypothetical protein [Halorubrum saccharovorum]ELZ41428.1 hypothetical protein C471_06103 [Halorubrum saccharovorum DSM 1137]
MASQPRRDPSEPGGDASDEHRDSGETEQDADPGPSSGAVGTEWLDRVWYRSRVGIALVVGDLLLTVTLVAAAIVPAEGPFAGATALSGGIVPRYVPVFSLLGALGFIFTTLIERFDGSTGRLLRHNFHLPAALPLGVGIFLLSDIILGETPNSDPLVVGLVFLSGLYVNLGYKRLGALARRLLPGQKDRSASDGAEESSSGESASESSG